MEERRFYIFKLGMKEFRFISDLEGKITYCGPVRDQPRKYRQEFDEITDPEQIEDIFKGH